MVVYDQRDGKRELDVGGGLVLLCLSMQMMVLGGNYGIECFSSE